MEKKTTGKFIYALRKANGMTQKDLAEKLNVSDKAVSRWERDECAPDLSLIPVIADIFGVTADELLRGERKSVDTTTTQQADENSDFSAKSKKQIKYMLNQSLMQYKIRCIITAVTALIGFIISAIINAFNYSYLGLGVGCIFYVIAAVCLIIFTIISIYRTNSDEFETGDTNDYKKSVAYITWLVASIILIIFNITMPLCMTGNSYFGLMPASWFGMGLIGAAVGIVICLIARFILTSTLTKRGIIAVTKQNQHNRKLSIKMCGICAAIIVVTLVGQLIFNSIATSNLIFVKGTTFYNFDDFKAYMETPLEYDNESDYLIDYVMIKDDVSNSDSEDYDEYYQEEVLTDSNGKELCRYIIRNENISLINYSGTDDYLPITVYTPKDHRINSNMIDSINIVFIFVYIIEIAVCLVIYLKKRIK